MSSRAEIEQARELAGVRSQHGRRDPARQLLGPARVRVQTVGVEHQGQAGGAREPPRERDRAFLASEPGAERQRAGAHRRVEHLLDAVDVQSARRFGQPPEHHLGHAAAGEHRLHRGGHEGGDIAGARAHRRARGHRGRAGQPDRAPRDEHVPGEELGRAARAARQQRQYLLGDQPGARLGRRTARDADVGDLDAAGVLLARPDPQAGLGGVEGDGHRGVHGLAFYDPRRGVDAARHIHAHHGRAGPLDRRDRLGYSSMGRAAEAGAEQRVDDHGRALERSHGLLPLRPRAAVEARRPRAGQSLEVARGIAGELLRGGDAHEHHFPPAVTQQPRDDEAVAAVVALAAHDRDRAVGHEPLERAHDGAARALHQIEARDALLVDRPAVGRPHRLGVGERREPGGKLLHDSDGNDARAPGRAERAGRLLPTRP